MNPVYSDHDSADESINKDNPYCFSSCNSTDINKTDKSITRTRRRKSSSEKGNRICVVCGEKASGFNFDRLTCESCKAFFRRNAMKPKEKMKPCPQGGGCNISGSQRKHCPYCRLEKCFNEGMKKELILPPEKLEQRAKPKRRKTNHGNTESNCLLIGQSSRRSNAKTTDSCGNVHNLLHQDSMDSQDISYQHRRLSGAIGNQHVSSSSPVSDNIPGALAIAKEECFTPPPSLQMEGAADLRGLHGSLSNEEDRALLATLSACVAKLKEPFTPQEHPPCDSEATPHTLEEAYNRMDTCIRRIIRLVKLLPAFFQMDKQLQLTLLRTNIYGLIIIYSSFFFEKEIKKLCYPVLSEDGSVRLITVSVSPSDLGFSDCDVTNKNGINDSDKSISSHDNVKTEEEEDDDEVNVGGGSSITTTAVPPDIDCDNENIIIKNENSTSFPKTHSTNTNNTSLGTGSGSLKQAVQEDFELYKENTIAAFTELQELTLDDNVLKVLILVIKLFEHDNLPPEMGREPVRATRNRYCGFLMRYLQAKHSDNDIICGVNSPTIVVNTSGCYEHGVDNSLDNRGSRIALLHFSRMLMSFIDICTLEIRMTEFAKLLSLDGLSPLMREVCSHRTNNSAQPVVSGTSILQTTSASGNNTNTTTNTTTVCF